MAYGIALAETPKLPRNPHIVGKQPVLQLPESPSAQSLPAVQNDRIEIIETAIKQARSVVRGQIRIDNCAITHGLGSAVRFRNNGREIDMRQVRFERAADEFSAVTSYTITGLPAGTHSLSLELTRTFQRLCAGGSWLPQQRRFSIKSNFSTVSHANFHYERDFIDMTIDGSVLTSQLNSLFNGTRMRINNHGPRRGRSNYVANDSMIQFPTSLGNQTLRFDIPEFRSDPYRYYVEDINLRRISTRIDGQFLVLALHLESQGPEFKGYCVTGNVACLFGRDDSAPDVQWNNDPRIEVLLRPIAREGSITFGEVQVRVRGDIQAGGVCSAIDICHLATNYDREIQRAIQNNMRSFLNQTSVRRMVARGLRPALDGLGIGRVMTAELRNGRLTLSYLPSV
jgi:hypothetical protein